ncbi:MAG: hypothetical protein IJP68_02805, partial [Selenomonadaceae bacterium]|nr:hypothetical protein [Selenomonadaceae bacterium]
LTSKFGGTYNVSKSGGSTIDGGLVSKKLTFKGTDAAESLLGGTGKTMFKGGGGNDTLQGGTGADTFFYAKGDKGSVTIADFDFEKDKLKIAGGTLAKVSVVGDNVQFAMKEGKGESPEVGWFNLTSFKKNNENATASNVLIKANNTYYWFAEGNETLASDDTLTTDRGALITSVSKINSSQTKGYDIIELNYSTNLVRSNVAVQVKDTLKPSSNT